MPEIAIVGPGAIGCVAAAWLAQDAANALTVCARSRLGDIVVETPSGTVAASPRVLLDPADAHPADWVLVCTKAHDAASTADWLARLVGPNTRVAILQNGVEHLDRFTGILDPAGVLPAIVDIPANRTGPGRVVQHALGTIVVPAGTYGDEFVRLFAASRIAVSTDPDIRTRAWRKLCINAGGAFSALTFAAPGNLWSGEVEAIVRGLVSECAAVGRAEGADIPQSVVEEIIEAARRPRASGVRNSLESDRLAGRPLELDARNGAVVRLGRRHGIPTPMNTLFVTLLGASETPWVTPIR